MGGEMGEGSEYEMVLVHRLPFCYYLLCRGKEEEEGEEEEEVGRKVQKGKGEGGVEEKREKKEKDTNWDEK